MLFIDAMLHGIVQSVCFQHPWYNESVGHKVGMMLDIVKTVRSMKEEYLHTKAKAEGTR